MQKADGNDSIDWQLQRLKTGATVKLDWSGTDVSLNTRKLTDVVDPTALQDAATKNYVDGAFANKTLSNLTSPTAINQDLVPDDTDNIMIIVSSAKRWLGSYIDVMIDGSDNAAFNIPQRMLLNASAGNALDFSSTTETKTFNNLVPSVNNSKSLGSSSFKFSESHVYDSYLYGATSGSIKLEAADITTTYAVKLPAAAPVTGQVLKATTATDLEWASDTTGVSSLAAIGATPNANGASISGTILNLQPADFSFGGVLTVGAQNIGGAKTFGSSTQFNSGIFVSTGNEAASGTDTILGGTNNTHIRLTNNALVSLAEMVVLDNTKRVLRFLFNATANPVTIRDNVGSVNTDYRIRTGTGSDITLQPNAGLWMIYDTDLLKWVNTQGVSNITGSGANGQLTFWSGTSTVTGSNLFKVNTSTQAIEMNGMDQIVLQTQNLLDNVAVATSIFSYADSFRHVVIEYGINRGSNYRTGRIMVTQDGTVGSMSDDFVEQGTTGVTFLVDVSGGIVYIKYISTNTGVNPQIKYNYRRW
jgi:hypothetical protein